MIAMELEGGENLYQVARRALALAAAKEDAVTFTFNTVESIVYNGQTLKSVVGGHFDELKRLQQERRAASPAYAEAERVLEPLSTDVRNALRDLLQGDGL